MPSWSPPDCQRASSPQFIPHNAPATSSALPCARSFAASPLPHGVRWQPTHVSSGLTATTVNPSGTSRRKPANGLRTGGIGSSGAATRPERHAGGCYFEPIAQAISCRACSGPISARSLELWQLPLEIRSSRSTPATLLAAATSQKPTPSPPCSTPPHCSVAQRNRRARAWEL